MKWILVILNVLVAIALFLLGRFAVSAHQTHAYGVYRELQEKHVLLERTDYDVERRLRSIANGGRYSSSIARAATGVCLLNAVALLLFWPKPKRTPLLEIIKMTKTHRTAYLGNTGHSYASLVGFITGYSFGVRYTIGDLSRRVLPDGFNEYVKNTLNGRHPSPTYGADAHWTDVILKEAGNDEAAFKLFYELWESFNPR